MNGASKKFKFCGNVCCGIQITGQDDRVHTTNITDTRQIYYTLANGNHNSISCLLSGLYIRVAHKNVPNFRTALCNRVIKINKVKSTYSVSKHLLISVKNFA